MLLRFEIRAQNEWCQNRSQISHFLTPVKIRGGVDENAEWKDPVHTMAKPHTYGIHLIGGRCTV